jgi:hypothetical protein
MVHMALLDGVGYSSSRAASQPEYLFLQRKSFHALDVYSSFLIPPSIFLPNYPATTSWLDAQEQAYAQWRLIDDAGEADDASTSSIKEALALVFADKRIYLFILLQHVSLLSQNFQYFFPTIVQTLGYNNIETLLITAPVWIATFFVSLFVTWTSGKTNDRSWHIICLMMISVVGGVICTATTNTGARFFAMFL